VTTSTPAVPYDLAIRGGWVIDPAQDLNGPADVVIRGDRIVAVGRVPGASRAVVDASQLFVSPGWIDLHVHVAHRLTRGSLDPDRDAGVAKGVTTVVDTGSCGAWNYDAFSTYVIRGAATRVVAFVNVSLPGLTVSPVHGAWEHFDQAQTVATVEGHPGEVVGVKVLASYLHCGAMDITPVELAVQAARLSGTRVMCHLGLGPPVIDEVLDHLEEGDIVTHCWHGKGPGSILDRAGRPIRAVRAAADRGVRFDIGHGLSSFSFTTARQAMAAGLPLHSISTDLHELNLRHPVRDLATTMAKFLHLGMSLRDVVAATTLGPASAIGWKREIGTLRPGACADVTVFRLREGPVEYSDASGHTELASVGLEPVATVRGGRLVDVAAIAGDAR
jgi:dihydroorotase